jgi:hypothetical protein
LFILIEKKTGLLRCYVSRVENGHTEPPKLRNLPKRKSAEDIAWGSDGKDANLLAQFCRLFSRLEEADLGMVLFMAQKMARRKAV